MPIDDPISALQAANATDDRQRSPVSHLAKPFLTIARLLAPPGVGVTLGGIQAAVEWLSGREEENRQVLVDAIAEEVKYCNSRIQQLVAASEVHRRFMEDEMPGLVLDALRRAERTRSKERISRLGRILVRAAEFGPRDSADYVEEMMRVALELTGRDVALLRELLAVSPIRFSRQLNRCFGGSAQSAWLRIQWEQIGLSVQDVESICGKLLSFGLVAALEMNHSPVLGEQRNTYELLQKGKVLLEYIRSEAETESPPVVGDAS